MNTQSQPIRSKLLSRWLVLLGLAISAVAGADTGPTLSDAAIYSTVVVPANLSLTPSVEWPTGNSDSYYSLTSGSGTRTDYNPSYEYVGYANPNYCYKYVSGNGGMTPVFGALNGYFMPSAAATNHTCSGQWSGNFLNWVWTHTIDSFRKTLTGGARIVDTGGSSGVTILQKAFSSSDGLSSQTTKSVPSAYVSGATPFNWSNFYTVDGYSGANFFFSGASISASTTLTTTAYNPSAPTACPSPNAATGTSTSNPVSGWTISANNTLTVSAGCTGTTVITTTNSSSVSLSASSQSGISYTWSPTSAVTKSSASNTLTISASSTAAQGTYTITITGTASGKSTSTTISLTVGPAPSSSSTTYSVQGAVQVCTSAELSGTYSEAESNSYTATAPDGTSMTVNGRCRGYPYGDNATPTNYKSVGLMQKYAAETNSGAHGITDYIRYSIFGYLKDTTGNKFLDGGVMRARMKSVGPYQANPGATVKSNSTATNSTWQTTGEWNSDGTFVVNPDAKDATNTPVVTNGGSTYAASNGATNGVTGSGVMNYLNKFGYPAASGFTTGATSLKTYKHNDSVSELYYMATRYYRNLPNLTSHTSTATEITNGTSTNDQFPVIENWDDPVAYSCSKNYIIGVGDIHTWYDGNVPGSSTLTGNENTAYSPTDDHAVSATSATDYLGSLEGTNNAGPTTGTSQVTGSLSGIGDNVLASSCGDGGTSTVTTGFGCTGSTFYIAGLAFDMHVRDIRPDLTNKTSPVTVSTFWLDVMENNTYHQKNQYWLAAKYGGFDTTYTYLQSGGTYNPFPINPSATSQVNPNNNGTAVGATAAANTYNAGSLKITYPAGSGTATSTALLPLYAWCGTGGQSCNVDDRGNYVPDQYFQAGKPWKMTAGLVSAFKTISAAIPSGTAAALALSSNSVTTSNTNYVASYDYKYGGDLQAQTIGLTQTGGVISESSVTTLWDAQSFLPPGNATGYLTYDTRKIATSSAQGASKGIAFRWASLSASASAELATLGSTSSTQKNVLNYVRGDQCNETASGTTLPSAAVTTPVVIPYACTTATGNTKSLGYRPRSTALGDIINSKLVTVGLPVALYGDAPLNPGYTSFVGMMTNTNGSSKRGTTLYVGANDGMMHAFDTSTGIEQFAYVPSALFTTNKDASGNAVGLTSLTASPLQHHFMVDGQATVVDIDVSRVNLSTSDSSWGSATSLTPDWRSVLIGGLGKGGGSTITSGTCSGTSCKVGGGYYAIDVTNPTSTTISGSASITNSSALAGNTSESVVAGKVLWEIDQSSSDFAHMGYSYQTPIVMKTKKYGWTLVLVSGYDNDDGSGWFYLVNPKTGALYDKISVASAGVTGTTAAPVGLAQVTAFIPDVSDYTADALYAADLLGNVYRVDLYTTSSSLSITKFATLSDGSTPQPVTTYPYIGVDPTGGSRYVFVGTGKLLSDTDLVLSQTQTFYAFKDGTSTTFDTSSSFPITRSQMYALSSTSLTNGIGGTTLASGNRGFYIDLAAAVTNGSATQASAERITVQPVAYSGIVGFAANLQGQDMCIKGSSRLFELNYDSGYANLGQSLIQNSSGTVVNYVGYSTGLVTNLAFGTSTSGLSGSGTPVITLLAGLDTTAGGSNKSASSSVVGMASTRSTSTTTRLNWREVPGAQ